MSKRLKSLISFLLAFLIFLEFSPVPKVNAESNEIQDINIYSLDARYTRVSIPDNYLTKYQIDLESLGFSNTDNAEYTILTPYYASVVLGYSVESGYAYRTKSITVSDTGEVTPGILTLYEDPNGYYYSYPIENYISVESYLYPGNAIVKVSVGTENRYLYFHHIDYADIYIQEQEDAFLGNANPQNAKDVARLGAEFAAQYPYEGRVSYAELMILEGHGNCWASADMVVKVAKRFGYNAWIRNGRKDTNAGSMHENAIVEDSELGIWYEVEAGYDQQEVPRYYEVRERTSLYSYRIISDNKIEVYSYDAEFKKDTETQISIPATIDYKTVTSIGVNFMEDERYDCLNIERVAIPKTITNIGENAFALNNKLTDVYYEGTEAEWELIEIANGNDYLTGATIHYNCNGFTEPTITVTPTPDPTITVTPTPDPTITVTPDPTITVIPTPEPTITDAPEPTLTDTPVPTLTESHAQVRANSLLLKDKIGVKFATYLPDAFLNDEGARAEINGNVCEIGPIDDRGRYPIVYYVAAAQMRDELVLKLYRSDGTEFPLLDKDGNDVTGTGCTYSVQAYIDEAKDPASGLNSDENLMMLLYRMEDYGSMAQLYFKYNEDNASFSTKYQDVGKVYPSNLEDYKSVINQVESAGIRRTGSTLSLKSATELNHKFVLDEGKSIEDYKFYVDGNLITTKSTGNVVLRYEQSSGKYVLSIKGIVAAKLQVSHTVVVKDSNDNVVITIENYSALSYAYSVIYNYSINGAQTTNDMYLVYLMKYLYLYNRDAVKYFNV